MDPWDPADWQRLSPILDALLDAPEERREDLLAETCGDDDELRAAVLRLVGHAERSDDAVQADAAEESGDAPPADGAERSAGGPRTVGGAGPHFGSRDPLAVTAAEYAADLLSTLPPPGLHGDPGRADPDRAPDRLGTRVPGARPAEAGDPPSVPPGTVIGGYRVLELLGRGGMGEVYRALHPALQREVALKVLPARRTRSADARRRLIEEARAASTLDHPAIQTVYDAGETEAGGVYVAFALYDGPTLRERLRSAGSLTSMEAARIGLALARGLAAAHGSGFVHRDVKPSNVIVFEDGRVKILDFGLATRVDVPEDPETDPTGPAPGGDVAPAPRAAYGTLAYMSPEQIGAGAVDARADIWALGVILHEMVAGERPFRGDTDRRLMRAIEAEEPAMVDAAPALGTIVARCLEKDPDDRYPSMAALAGALEGFVEGAESRTRLAGASTTADRALRPPRRALAIAAIVALAISAAVYAVLRGERSADADATNVLAAATSMTILPFVPVPADTALARLGRQLAITLSTTVDGMGAIRTTEGLTVLSAVESAPDDGAEAADARTLARRFASSSYVQGTLLRTDAGAVRIDGAVHDAGTAEEIARFTATAPGRDITALTDSVTLALVRGVWRSGEVPAPSLAALTTSSVPALRAYLDGELLLAAGRFAPAVEAFDSAFAADENFWFALYRSLYPRTYEGTPGLRRELAERLFENRAALPEPDRLLLEADRITDVAESHAARRDIVRRFPSYMPGWWAYANGLVHRGPYAGIPLAEARRAVEQTLSLDPEYFPAWEHLLWLAVVQRDRSRAREALDWLEAEGRRGNRRIGEEIGATYHAMVAGLDGPLDDPDVDDRVDAILAYRGPLLPYFALDLLVHGDPVNQTRVNREVLRRGAPPGAEPMYRISLAMALAGRGDWDAALAAAAAAGSTTRGDSFDGFPIAVVGAWLGELRPEEAVRYGRDVAPVAMPRDPSARAELAWLEGLLAFALGDSLALDSARGRTADSGGAFAEDLRRSLDAFALALAGDTAAAGRALADLEREAVDRFIGRGASHPWVGGVNRLAAARWLTGAGDTVPALSLLGWEEATFSERSRFLWPAGIVLSPHSTMLRARLRAERGETQEAARHYATVLHRYDLAATGGGRDLVLEARRYLGGRGEG